LDLFPLLEDIFSLTKQIESLNIEVNTQGLKTEVERLKRRRLGANLKQMRQSSIHMQKALAHLQQENHILKEQISTTANIHYSERARLSMWVHCGISRIYQILIWIIPRIPMTPNEHGEVAQLTHELLRAAQQIMSQNNARQVD